MASITVIRYDGDLKREVWDFTLYISWVSSCIYFESYSFQTKKTTRYKSWEKQTHWVRLEHRNNNIDKPPLPPDVEVEVRSRYQEYILTLPIS